MNAFLSNYNNEGYAIVKGLIPHDIIDTYTEFWLSHHSKDGNFIDRKGWNHSHPFVKHPEIRELLCSKEIYNYLNLLNNDMTLAFCFTTWISTQYAWHQDVLESDKSAARARVGVWIALDDIHVDSGPFELVVGSHNWDVDWEFVLDKNNKNPAIYFSEMINYKNAEVKSFTANKGDVLFWQGHTVHRGSVPNDQGLLRKSLIASYNAGSNNPIKKYKFGQYDNMDKSQVDLYGGRDLPN